MSNGIQGGWRNDVFLTPTERTLLRMRCNKFDLEVFKEFKRYRRVGWARADQIARWVYGDGLDSDLTSRGRLREKNTIKRFRLVVRSLEALAYADMIFIKPPGSSFDIPKLREAFPGPTLYAIEIPGPGSKEND